jgi:hypothetical protein
MAVHKTTKKKPSGSVYHAAWFYCPVSRTKGPTLCAHRTRYRTDKIESRVANRAMEAMRRKPVAVMVARVNEALKQYAARASWHEDELRADLAKPEGERDRWLDAIASGGDTFAAVRDRLADAEQRVAAITADLERARFEKRIRSTPTAIPVGQVVGYLRRLRRLAKTDVAKAKTALAGLLDGDLILHPAADGQPARVTGRLNPPGVVGVPVSIAGVGFEPTTSRL